MTTAHATERHEAHTGESLGTYIVIYVALLVLLVITVMVAEHNLGPWNAVVALIIAAIKAGLVILFFMHVRQSSKIVWVFAFAGFLWLAIFLSLSFSDYGSYNNGGRHAGAQADLKFSLPHYASPDEPVRNPLRPLVP